jgi:hypothetical protein
VTARTSNTVRLKFRPSFTIPTPGEHRSLGLAHPFQHRSKSSMQEKKLSPPMVRTFWSKRSSSTRAKLREMAEKMLGGIRLCGGCRGRGVWFTFRETIS